MQQDRLNITDLEAAIFDFPTLISDAMVFEMKHTVHVDVGQHARA